MIGRVQSLHVLLPVTLRLPDQPDLTLDFVVDTGFTGILTLPEAAVAAMGLPLIHREPVSLADDSTVEVAVHAAEIVWNDVAHEVRVLATGRRPLLGTALLNEQELVVQFTEGGLVTVEDL